MKVLLINGSPHANGCTFTALNIVAEELQKNGIETEIVHIGNKDIRGYRLRQVLRVGPLRLQRYGERSGTQV